MIPDWRINDFLRKNLLDRKKNYLQPLNQKIDFNNRLINSSARLAYIRHKIEICL